jgi:ABC-type glycerol-3-phosphate transport system permease component
MSTTPTTHKVDLAPRRAGLPYLAVGAGVVAVLLSVLAWDWFSWGGVVLGVPAGVVALVLGLRARREGARGMGTAAIALAAVTVVLPLAWIIGDAVS